MKATSLFCLSAAGLAISVAAAFPASAQSAPVSGDKEKAKEAPPEIIVTAERREENLQDVPIAATALTGDQPVFFTADAGHRHRLDEIMYPDRVAQLLQRLFIKIVAGLPGVHLYLAQRYPFDGGNSSLVQRAAGTFQVSINILQQGTDALSQRFFFIGLVRHLPL